MAFWRTETLRERLPSDELIQPFNEKNVVNCSYELCMGPEAFVTSTAERVKTELDANQSLVIPSGQFALLLTEERVKVPLDAIAFISVKFRWKRRGLINVSGFHVDPGFDGKLKFSVYNAGSSDITISRGDRAFLIWYADLDGPTEDGYGVAGEDQNRISSDDQNIMHGDVSSPAELKLQIDELKHFDFHLKWLLGVIAIAFIGILIRLSFTNSHTSPTSTDMDKLKTEIMSDVQKEVSEFKKHYELKIESTANDGGGDTNKNKKKEEDKKSKRENLDKGVSTSR